MQNTSTAFKAAVISTKRTLAAKAVLQTADATIYNLGPGDIVAGSLSVNAACFDDGIELGSTVASDCSIGLNNYDGRWNSINLDGATLWPYSGLVLPDTTTEYVKLGTFIIDVPGRPYSQVSIQASDRMILLDEPFSAVTRTFPATNLQILQAIGTHCLVPLASSITGILNAAYSVTARPTDDLTCRDVVGMIALMAAGFARTNRDGELEIVQLPDLSGTIAVQMPVGSRYEGFMQTSDPVTVTGLTYFDADETVQLGTDAYSLQVDKIPLLQANRDTILSSIWAVISGCTYTGFTCPYPGNPAIDPGDSVQHVTMDGKTITSLIASHNFVHGGQSTMEATAKSQAEMSYKGANARRLSTIAAKIQTVDTRLTAYQQVQAQFTDLLTQAMGYFTTDELQEDGSTIHYEHDHPLLADSVVIYKKTATTMSWTDDAGAHWYGMTASGNILARVLTAIGVNADWINAGYLDVTNRIAAGAITTPLLAAKCVTSEQMLVGSPNMLNDVDSFEQFVPGSAWTGYKHADVSAQIASSKSYHGKNSMYYLNSGFLDSAFFYIGPSAVTTGYLKLPSLGRYLVSCYVCTDTGYTMNIRLGTIAKAGQTTTVAAGVTTPYGSTTITSSSGWKRVVTYVDVTSLADDPYIVIGGNAYHASQNKAVYWDAFQVEYIGERTDVIPSLFAAGAQTRISGNNITTGKVQSTDGKTYFDLNNSEIKETATVGGKSVLVYLSPAKGLETWLGGYKKMYTSSAGVWVDRFEDVNEDGYVDQTDIDIVAEYILSDATRKAELLALYPKMDVNHSGTISSSDLTLICRAAGQMTTSVSGSGTQFKYRKYTDEDGTMRLVGWGWIVPGTLSSPYRKYLDITYPTAFVDIDSAIAGIIGYKASSDPASILEMTGEYGGNEFTLSASAISLSVLRIEMYWTGVPSATARYGFSFQVTGRWKKKPWE